MSKCTKEDILREQEILKREPDMINVKTWSYGVKSKKIKSIKSIKPFDDKTRDKHTQRIRCVETGEIFDNVKQAGKEKHLNKKLIWKSCLHGYGSMVGGYHWEFVDTEGEDE